MKKLKATFILNDDELKEIEELQEAFHQYKDEDGNYLFKNYTLEKTFDTIMTFGAGNYIREKIKYAKLQLGLIDRETYIGYVLDDILTPEDEKETPEPKSQKEKKETMKNEMHQKKTRSPKL